MSKNTKIKINPKVLDNQLPLNPLELEAKIFFLKELPGGLPSYTFVTDEIKFPYELLKPCMEDIFNIGTFDLNYERGIISFYHSKDFGDMPKNKFLKGLFGNLIKIYIENNEIFKGNKEVLKKYGISLSKA